VPPMANDHCDKCKPDRPEMHSSAISNSTANRCGEEYKEVQACMAVNKGNISPCALVWDAFKLCHSDATASRKQKLVNG